MAVTAAAAQVGFGTPFAAAIEHLRRKLDLPTDRWDDIRQAAHDRAFIVAGAAKADLLQDLHQAVIAAAEGGGLAGFRKDFKAIVARHGWTGWTGEGSAAGVAWRTRVIYQTNMATSYAAGRWHQLTDPAAVALMPWFTYRHADGVLHPRPLHQAWDGLTLKHDHPFWRTHWAPNGWGCHCKVFAVAQPDKGAKTEPPAGWNAIDPKTGEQVGIDRGFGYAPGANAATPLAQLIGQKLIALDAPIGAAMWDALAPSLAMERQQAWWEALDAWLADPVVRGRNQVIGGLQPELLDVLPAEAGRPANAAIAVPDRLVVGAKQRQQGATQAELTLTDLRGLPMLLDRPGGVYLDLRSGHLVYVADSAGATKAAVEFAAAASGQAAELVSGFRVTDAFVAGAVKGGQWQVLL